MTHDIRTVVIGLAVIDVVLDVPHLPSSANPSVQVQRRSSHPGGKGLTQAVAARLLRMNTAIITPIAGDADSQLLMNLLERHEISTLYMPTAPPSDHSTITPRVYVLRTPSEDYYCAFKNETDLPLRASFLRASAISGFINNSDIVFLTFEVPQEAIHQVITELISSQSQARLVVTASPVRDDLRLDSTILRRIDLLVGSDEEIRQLSPRRPVDDTWAVLQRLVNDGIRNAVALTQHEILMASRHLSDGLHIEYPEISSFDTAGARDAFAVHLAHQLHRTSGRLRPYDVRLASVAYGLAASRFGESESMPALDEIMETAKHLNILEPL